MSSLHNIEIKLYDLQDEFENCESDNNYKKICEELITLASELVEKLDRHYDKLNEIDEYIGENINDQNLIDYESLVWELKKDNLYTDEVESWLDRYMKFYNKKVVEEINIWN
jgi:hypothetical protein